MSVKYITILGSTGSIGESTLDVVLRHPEQFQVFALTTNTRVEKLIEQAVKCNPKYLVVADDAKYIEAHVLIKQSNLNCELLCGAQALEMTASAADVDVIMAAIVGAAGLMPTLAAVNAGKRVLLANKESLVMSGELFIRQVNETGATLLPIDSEHNAIFQCLPANYQYGNPEFSGIAKVLLTGSGGPFLDMPLEDLPQVTPEQACAHPNWSMGQKISVDSATMMNKGLEFIEACWLFGLAPKDIEVVLHPQSMIHSMVQYVDGSVLAQMGNPDMRTPIAHALSYPDRINAGVAPMDFTSMRDFTFTTPCMQRYPNLHLAMEAFSAGQYACTSLNAANEIAVGAFLDEKIGFVDIHRINESVLAQISESPTEDIQQVLSVDQHARELAEEQLRKFSC